MVRAANNNLLNRTCFFWKKIEDFIINAFQTSLKRSINSLKIAVPEYNPEHGSHIEYENLRI